MKNFFFLAVIMISLAGCFPMDNLSTVEFGVSPLIFQSEYTNNAWGYNHNGWMMDGSGRVKRFQKNAPWVFPDSLGYVSVQDMQKNLAACDSVLTQIGSQEFSQYAEKALSCFNGTLTEPQNTMADAGEHIYAFYLYDADHNRYKRVVLTMTGDWSQENLASNTGEIVEWMSKIK